MMAVPALTPELAGVWTGERPHRDEPPWQWPIDVTVYDRRALGMLYRGTVEQAHVLAYGDAYFLLTVVFSAVILLLPWMRRVRVEQTEQRPTDARVEGLPEPAPD